MRTVTERTISARINANGAVAWASAPIAVNKTGVGTYVVSLPPAFRLLALVGNTRSGGGARSFDTSVTPSGNTITCYTLAAPTGALTDFDFQFTAVGA